MLTHLNVHNYTLVDELSLEIKSGLTTLTGETGAGKSLLLDAIGLAIGNKARGDAINEPTANAEVTATFEPDNSMVQQKINPWFNANGLPESSECLLKRIITPQGRSRCFINGRAVTLTQLHELGALLINIHGQHEHQALLNNNTQRKLIDTYGNYPQLTHAVKTAFNHWQNAQQVLNDAIQQADALSAQYQLLKYQVEELEQLSLQEDELQNLEAQQKKLANAEAGQTLSQSIIDCSRDNELSIQNQLVHVIAQIKELHKLGFNNTEAQELFQTALIHQQEAVDSIEKFALSFEESDMNLHDIEQRLSEIYTVARKHKINPESLYSHQQQLLDEFAQLNHSDEHIQSLQNAVEAAHITYTQHSSQLTKARAKAGKKICKDINLHLKALNMSDANFCIEFEPTNQPSRHGDEQTVFLISTIPNKVPGPLNKIASGGELSRIGLAIQVATATTQTIPTLIFDEVDAGIGGTTGDVVGHLLRELGSSAQVLCVTHLAQVASKAHNHLLVQKSKYKNSVRSSIQYLQNDAVVSEVARMVGGPIDTETSLAHAREMMTNS